MQPGHSVDDYLNRDLSDKWCVVAPRGVFHSTQVVIYSNQVRVIVTMIVYATVITFATVIAYGTVTALVLVIFGLGSSGLLWGGTWHACLGSYNKGEGGGRMEVSFHPSFHPSFHHSLHLSFHPSFH